MLLYHISRFDLLWDIKKFFILDCNPYPEKIICKHFDDAVKIAPMSPGRSNAKLYTFEVCGKKHVLRILDSGKFKQQDRRSELTLATIASDLTVSPHLSFENTNEKVSYYVMDFIKGIHPTTILFNNVNFRSSFIQTLKKLHAAKIDNWSNIHLNSYISRYRGCDMLKHLLKKNKFLLLMFLYLYKKK